MWRASWCIGFASMIIGCGGSGSSPGVDAGVDAAVVDAVDEPPPDASVNVTPGSYVTSAAVIPMSNAQAQQLGLDLDGVSAVDNQLGMVFATLAGQGFDTQLAVTESIDRGGSIILVELRADATLRTHVGANPNPPACTSPSDPVCRHHLDGDASFEIATGSTSGTMPITATTATTVTGGPGTATLSMLLPGAAMPTHLDLIGARFVGTVAPTGITNAKLAGAVSSQQIDIEIIPALAMNFRDVVDQDCPAATPPTCACTAGSSGETLLGLFDADNDCVISDDEVRNNSLVMSLLAPDVTINGVDALSLGIGLTAVPATFTAP